MTIPTTTSLFVGPPGAEPATLVATVTAAYGAPAQGLVRFFDGKNEIGSVRLDGLAAGHIAVTLGVEPHELSARFEGDGPYGASTSPVVSVDRADYTFAVEGGGCSGGGSSAVAALIALALILVRRTRRA